jgi:hypothetical protein
VSFGAVTKRNVELFTVVDGAEEVVDALLHLRGAAPAQKRLSRT